LTKISSAQVGQLFGFGGAAPLDHDAAAAAG
jgi:hypothetical protein